MFADWTDRIASRRAAARAAAAAAGRRAQHRHHALGLADAEGTICTTRSSTDKRKPTVNANGLIYGVAGGEHRHGAGARPGEPQGMRGPASRTAIRRRRPRRTPRGAVALLGRGGDLGQPDEHPQSDVRRERPRLVHRADPPAGESGLLQGGLATIRRPRSLPLEASAAQLVDVRPEDRQVDAHRHLLRRRTICISPRTPTTRCGPAAGGPAAARSAGSNTKMFEQTGDERSRRAGRRSSSTPTATASATSMSSRTSRSIRRRTSASAAAFYGVQPSPVGRLHLGPVDGVGFSRRSAGYVLASCPAPIPPDTALTEIYQPPVDTGFGPRGLDIDTQRRRLDAARQRPSRELRPPQVQGSAQRAEAATGKHCPEGWTLYRFPGPQFKGVDANPGSAEPRYYVWVDQLQHARASGRTFRSPPATAADALLALVNGKCVDAAGALSDRASSPRASTAASTTRRPAGKARGSGPPPARARVFHIEGGKASRPQVFKVQCGPDPLAR